MGGERATDGHVIREVLALRRPCVHARSEHIIARVSLALVPACIAIGAESGNYLAPAPAARRTRIMCAGRGRGTL